MKVMKLAAGFAVGYVLGSRAGRGAYEQIAANARQLRDHPTVRQGQEKTKALLSNATEAATAKLHRTAAGSEPDMGTTASGRAHSAPNKAAVAAPVEPAVSGPLS